VKFLNNNTTNRRFQIPGADKLENAFKKMSDSEQFITLFFSFLLLLSTLILLGKINAHIVIDVPAPGGEIKEGIVGFPRFVNPLLASSDADRDISILAYSGLMKATPEGDLIYDLAESHTVSDDGLLYTFKIKENAVFHDGTKVTADDVLFTVSKTRDVTIKSPKRANWEGVFVEKLNDREIQFSLKEPYTPFLENTTLGILPKHIWDKVEPEQFAFSSFNVEPIGSGPYRVTEVHRNSSGIPEFYELKSFDEYVLGEPHISKIQLHFYSNEEQSVSALKSGKVDAINSISAPIANTLKDSGRRVEQFQLPRIFGVFFNQNRSPLFTNIEVRKALSIAIDRDRIINEILDGYGTPITSPIPGTPLNTDISNPLIYADEDESALLTRTQIAKDMLLRNGWEFDEEKGALIKETSKSNHELTFTISTSNASELKQVADIVKESWEAIGANITVELFEVGNLNQDVIRPREYDALLFGEIIGREKDLFAFWHSSQRNDPGLNIASYANIQADSLLEDMRTVSDKKIKEEKFNAFENEIQSDIPSTFLYSPDFIYVISKDIKGFNLGTVTTPAERFLSIHNWYINTDRVWQFFSK